MRLWSLHPSYLDTKGLVACWREGLLARKVLQGKTRGYRNHPQLQRFKILADPVGGIDQYLSAILAEADRRGFAFVHTKIEPRPQPVKLTVTEGQLVYELSHLRSKLIHRDPAQYTRLATVDIPLPNPVFTVVAGEIEPWEKVSP